MHASLAGARSTGATARASGSSAQFLVIGAGGLGCPALLGLLAGGARRITIVDDDLVDLSNLPRQVLFSAADVGTHKVDAARHALLGRSRIEADASPAMAITTVRQRLVPEELDVILNELTTGASRPWVVLECSDSPALKFAVHDACLRARLRVVMGGVVGWHGQAMAIDPRQRDAACYRCLFEGPPPPELAPACASVGVAGPVAGAVGHAMATLAVSLANADAPHAPSPAGVCLHFDLLHGSVRRLAPKPRPNCVTCSTAVELHANTQAQDR
ncbi:Sulfur carrier protein adenylyltransferase ThiF [Enhygromyxa salina]|uniref:Sulfur carrier protein adenylyltransferase ThiF n=1 Tax=Enhygromyxa salina TaxID=215803 RepID=A0A0C1ZQJ1_9BACT|nr:ThiF family adenylyltransferase [Enhygromyxa salina]KIG13208.1 Sulfur carrier protein adenylyltransferase ThiF [Enhygromyxa salina]